MKYKLVNSCDGDSLISKHRSLRAAIKAQIRHAQMVTRVHGRDSYINTQIQEKNGSCVDSEVYWKEATDIFYEIKR